MSQKDAQTARPGMSGTHGTVKSYTIGFVLSLALTIEAYLLVANHTFAPSVVVLTVLVLAIVQLLVQLFFFLHLDRATKSPWNIIMFLFMGLVVSILVFGSLWIMRGLDYNMTTRGRSPAQTDQEIRRDEGIMSEH